jgi:hypothetical protein
MEARVGKSCPRAVARSQLLYSQSSDSSRRTPEAQNSGDDGRMNQLPQLGEYLSASSNQRRIRSRDRRLLRPSLPACSCGRVRLYLLTHQTVPRSVRATGHRYGKSEPRKIRWSVSEEWWAPVGVEDFSEAVARCRPYRLADPSLNLTCFASTRIEGNDLFRHF